MRPSLLLLPLALLISTSPADASISGCVSCSGLEGVLSHPRSCSHYIICRDGQPSFYQCDDGFAFNAEEAKCVPSHETKCIDDMGTNDLKACPEKSDEVHVSPRKSGSLSTSGACSQTCSDYEGLVGGGETHSVCVGENSSCQKLNRGMSSSDADQIMHLHNVRRNTLALGQENGASTGSSLPAGTNIKRLVWNGELAKVAQGLTDGCEFQNDCNNCRKITSRLGVYDYDAVGQNLFALYSTDSSTPDWEAPLKSWWGEVSEVTSEGQLSNFNWMEGYYFGTFSQAAWADTYEIGCGWTVTPGSPWNTHLITCNYGGAGNWEGGSVYQFGFTASQCPEGIDGEYSGLCSPPHVSDPCDETR